MKVYRIHWVNLYSYNHCVFLISIPTYSLMEESLDSWTVVIMVALLQWLSFNFMGITSCSNSSFPCHLRDHLSSKKMTLQQLSIVRSMVIVCLIVNKVHFLIPWILWASLMASDRWIIVSYHLGLLRWNQNQSKSLCCAVLSCCLTWIEKIAGRR